MKRNKSKDIVLYLIQSCTPQPSVTNDRIDNDCDGAVDEEQCDNLGMFKYMSCHRGLRTTQRRLRTFDASAEEVGWL